MLTELDVVNAQLATMGEAPLNDLTIPHPYVSAGLGYLRKTSRQTQALGWWFNTKLVDLTPDPENAYSVEGQLPCGVLSMRGPYGYAVSMRGTGVYDHVEGQMLEKQLNGVSVTYELPFVDLPPTAQQYVMDKAVLAFQKEFDGSDRKTQLLQNDVNASYVIMNQEHIRTVKANKLRNPNALSALLAIRGDIQYGLPTRSR